MKINIYKYDIAYGVVPKVSHIRDRKTRELLCTDKEIEEYPMATLVPLATCDKCINKYKELQHD